MTEYMCVYSIDTVYTHLYTVQGLFEVKLEVCTMGGHAAQPIEETIVRLGPAWRQGPTDSDAAGPSRQISARGRRSATDVPRRPRQRGPGARFPRAGNA